MGTCPDAVKRLVDRFQQHADEIRSPDYNEALIRIDFINPLMTELGWDIENRQGFAERYREVVHEDRVKVAGQTKAPDYSFRIGGQRKFFLEAKKPAVDIKNNWEPAYQLRRYAWSAKLACSLLTDFEELAIYDARIQPKQLEKASVARREFIRYTDYCDRWDFLAGTFSKDAVLRGEFDKYCESKKGRGAQPFDDAFLAEIEQWRKAIATSLARHNPALDEQGLNFAVQRIIDRIIFLRIAEDRGTEPVAQLQALVNGDRVYERLNEVFRRADERYNSGLFHFAREKDRDENPDTLTPALELDDKTLRGIIKGLYYPQSPYEFTVVSADILGSVYERFLGKVITLTAGHNAKVEEKPEVRKAGGVYYTPTYIVDYIVKNTVGKLLPPTPSPGTPGEGRVEGLSPKYAPKLKILDPACGSGSFLIGAYQFLLDWYLAQYTAGDATALATGKKPVLRPGVAGGWALTINERKRILLDHIHGVDLDDQAVEVTKLNLLLKCLEGETSQTLGFEQRLFRERALPDLGRNIKCGNSLIGMDIIGTKAWEEMSEDLQRAINPFDYNEAFPQVFKQAGFDVVLGNPPYIRVQRIRHEESDYLFAHYKSPASKLDLSLVFLEKSLQVLNDHGLAAFICTSQWMATDYGRNLRELLSHGELHEITDFGSLPVFAGVSTYPAIFVLGPERKAELRYRRIESRSQLTLTGIASAPLQAVALTRLTPEPWNLLGLDVAAIARKAGATVRLLDELGNAYIGLKTGMNEAFVVSGAEVRAKGLEGSFVYPYAYQGEEVKRYAVLEPAESVIYPYVEGADGDAKLVEESVLRAKAPHVLRHLAQFKPELQKRMDSRRLYALDGKWFRHLRAGSFRHIRPKKLVMKGIAKRNEVGLLPENTAFDGANCPVIIIDKTESHATEYFLALLNSRLLSYVLRLICPAKLSGYVRYSANGVGLCPIRLLNLDEKSEKATHDRLVSLVGTMLSLHKRLAAEQLPQRREQVQREIDATDRQIDQLVYQLYGLTDDEIRIVEAATR
jgi:hypothetical protein